MVRIAGDEDGPPRAPAVDGSVQPPVGGGEDQRAPPASDDLEHGHLVERGPADPVPRGAAVGGLEDAVPEVGVAVRVGLAGPHVDRARRRGGDGDGPHRLGGKGAADGPPVQPAVGGLPHAAIRGALVHDVRVVRIHGHRGDPARGPEDPAAEVAPDRIAVRKRILAGRCRADVRPRRLGGLRGLRALGGPCGPGRPGPAVERHGPPRCGGVGPGGHRPAREGALAEEPRAVAPSGFDHALEVSTQSGVTCRSAQVTRRPHTDDARRQHRPDEGGEAEQTQPGQRPPLWTATRRWRGSRRARARLPLSSWSPPGSARALPPPGPARADVPASTPGWPRA